MQMIRIASLLGVVSLTSWAAPAMAQSANPAALAQAPAADAMRMAWYLSPNLVATSATGAADPMAIAPDPVASSWALNPTPVEPPQGGGMNQTHPPTMVAYTFAYGTERWGLDTGVNGDLTRGHADSIFNDLRLEHFFDSQLGVYLNGEYGSSDKLGKGDLGITADGVRVDTTMVFLAVSYRATINDYFRMPVRFGPYYHQATVKGFSGGDTDYSTLGIKLSAEPEYVIFQRTEGDKMSELTAFLELSVGAGPSHVKQNDLNNSERGDASSIGAELGARYRLKNGVLVGLSGIYRQQNYGATTSHNDTTFFSTIDEFLGIGLTVGMRF